MVDTTDLEHTTFGILRATDMKIITAQTDGI